MKPSLLNLLIFMASGIPTANAEVVSGVPSADAEVASGVPSSNARVASGIHKDKAGIVAMTGNVVAWTGVVEGLTQIPYANSSAQVRGDTIFPVSNGNPTVCIGAFISQNDRLYSEIVSTVRLAYALGSSTAVYVDPTVVWPDSNFRFCKLLAIEVR